MPRPGSSEEPASERRAEADTAVPHESDSWYRAYVTANPHLGTPEENAPYFARIFEDAPAAYIVTDRNTTIRDANKAAQRLLKRPLGWLRGKAMISIVSSSERPVFSAMIPELIAVPSVFTRQLRLQPSEGDHVDVFFSACTARDGSGNPEAIFWIFLHPLEQGEDLL